MPVRWAAYFDKILPEDAAKALGVPADTTVETAVDTSFSHGFRGLYWTFRPGGVHLDSTCDPDGATYRQWLHFDESGNATKILHKYWRPIVIIGEEKVEEFGLMIPGIELVVSPTSTYTDSLWEALLHAEHRGFRIASAQEAYTISQFMRRKLDEQWLEAETKRITDARKLKPRKARKWVKESYAKLKESIDNCEVWTKEIVALPMRY